MFQRVQLIGNLGDDPESGEKNRTTWARFRMATSERWTDRDGEKQEHTEWHTVSCFGRTAENVVNYLSKGSKVFVEGKLRTTKYERDGVERYSTTIKADIIRFLDTKKDDGEGGGRRSSGGGRSQDDGGYRPGDDDDIPF